MTPLLAYQLFILAVLVVLLGLTAVNLLVLPRIARYNLDTAGARPPSVAVLVPARNEEANIEPCLRGLLSQTYPDFEVWLYDDASTDATGEIAARLARESRESVTGRRAHLHIVRGDGDPPPGWLGKANACHHLYMALRGRQGDMPDYLLFTDADVRHAPTALAHAVAAAERLRAGLLSIFPRQNTSTWVERLAVPLVQHWGVYGILPLPLAFMRQTGPAFAAANGQFMLFSTEAYEACGGHAAVRSQILEDVALARAVKRAGLRALLADGGPLVRTRMYRGAGEVWAGYSKNTYAFFGYSPFFLAIGILAMLALYVAPPSLALLSIATGRFTAEWFYLPLAQYLAAVVMRLMLAARFRSGAVGALLHPAGVLYICAVLINSMRWARGGRTAWKGRMGAPASKADG